MKIKTNIHSTVDLITNSSTTIYTYQNSITQAKELVQEMLNLCGITDKTPDDIFHYGVFCSDYRYLDKLNDVDEEYDEDEENEAFKGLPKVTAEYNTPEYKKQCNDQKEWFDELQEKIIKGEVKKPKWMKEIEEPDDYYHPDTELLLITKDDKYKVFGEKMQKLLDSVHADGGMEY